MEKTRTKLSLTDRHNIVFEYQYGVRAEVLAERYKITASYVYILVRRYAKQTRRKQPEANRQEQQVDSCFARSFLPIGCRGRAKIREGYRKKEKMQPKPVDQGKAVRHHRDMRRGFVIPAHRELDYIELLKQGYSRIDAYNKVMQLDIQTVSMTDK